MDVIVYAHTHWDREWYRPFQEFRLRLVDVFENIINDLSSNKMDYFYLDGQTIVLEDYLEVHPHRKQEIIDLIKQKKLMIGPWYVLADEFLVSGESLIRNLLIGINQAKELGCNDFVGYMPDSFGHNSEIPKILNSFNIDSAILWRGAGHKKSEFIWKSSDGSSVLTAYLIEGYFQDILSQNYSIEEKTRKIAEFLKKIKEHAADDIILLPVGGDHLAAPINLNDQIKGINEHIRDFKLCLGQAIDYINNIKSRNLKLEEFTGELRDNSRNFILPGVYSTRLYLKKANAISTWKLCKLAEPLQAYLENLNIVPNRRNELEYAWKLLLKNHPHDSICGCSVDEVHDEMIPRFNQVDQISDGLIARSFHELAHRTKEGKLIIYNASDYTYNGVARVSTPNTLPENLLSQYITSTKQFPQEILFDIHRVPIQEDIKPHNEHFILVEDVPPHSITIIDDNYKYKKHPTIVETTKNFIKNSRIKLMVNNDGSLVLSDSDTGKELNNLHLFYDYADKGDTYNFCPLKHKNARKGTFIKSEVVEDGKLRGVLRLFYELEIPESLDVSENLRSMVDYTHMLVVDAVVYADSRRVEFSIMWENFSRDHALLVKFRFDEKVYRTIAENNLGLIERNFNPDYSLREHMPAEAGKELKTNTAPMQRFVWANGLGVITEGLSEYGVDGYDLYVTLLRSVGVLSRGTMDTRGTPAGPPLEIPGAQCLGIQRFRYAICAVNKPEELFMEADEFMGCILTETGVAKDDSQESTIPGRLLSFENHNIYTYAVKPPFYKDKKGVVVRLMNLSDSEQSINLGSEFSQITRVNSLEETVDENLNENIKFKPFELKSLLLEQ